MAKEIVLQRRLSLTRLSVNRSKHNSFWKGQRGYYFDDLPDQRGFGASQKRELIKELKSSQFDPTWHYKPWQLDLWADVWLREFPYDGPAVLSEEQYIDRLRHEIYVASGTPDETITNNLSPDGQMFYWRTSPRGRRVNSKEQRDKNGASFYR